MTSSEEYFLFQYVLWKNIFFLIILVVHDTRNYQESPVPKTPPVLETKSVQPLNNPWIKNLKQENICPQPNLSDIVQDELQKMKDIDRIQKKPFEYIQVTPITS